MCLISSTVSALGSLICHRPQWSSWFLGFCLVRTFSNSVEATLTVAAFAYWPWRGSIPSSSASASSSSTSSSASVSSSTASSSTLSSSLMPSTSSSSPSSLSASSSRFVALSLAAAAFVFRPTSALPWALLGVHHLFTCIDPMRLVFAQVVPIAIVAGAYQMSVKLRTRQIIDVNYYQCFKPSNIVFLSIVLNIFVIF